MIAGPVDSVDLAAATPRATMTAEAETEIVKDTGAVLGPDEAAVSAAPAAR